MCLQSGGSGARECCCSPSSPSPLQCSFPYIYIYCVYMFVCVLWPLLLIPCTLSPLYGSCCHQNFCWITELYIFQKDTSFSSKKTSLLGAINGAAMVMDACILHAYNNWFETLGTQVCFTHWTAMPEWATLP